MNDKIEVNVNGQPQPVASGSTLADLLMQMGLEQQPCAVELNLEIVPRETFSQVQLQPNDQLEIVTLVGGG